MSDWIPCSVRMPPRGGVVETKVHDEQGERNVRRLKLHDSPGSRLWFFPDGSMYTYYTPTHWRPVQEWSMPMPPDPAPPDLDAVAADLAELRAVIDAAPPMHFNHEKPGARLLGHAEALLARCRELERVNERLRARVAALEEGLRPFARVWTGDQDGTARIPWDALKRAAEMLKAG